MSVRVTDRLTEARRRRFVGRVYERGIFRDALATRELPFQVLYVYGPGGIGKTTLLGEFTALTQEMQIPVVRLDAREIDPSPPSFQSALELALGTRPQSLFEHLAASPSRRVLILDTFEALEPLDAWLRDVFVPQLPAPVLVVLASRNPPAPGWRADAGWQTFFRPFPLRNLAPEESRAYLAQRNIPSEEHTAILDFTHGHPLALSLVADAFAQRPNIHFRPEAAPDVIQALLEQLVQKVPSPAHRAALEACALVRVTTEALLAEMLSTQDAHELFEWLRGLSFIESSREGIFPHDLARETLAADLRWRNPDWHKQLHQRARGYYTARIERLGGIEQHRVLFDFVFLHRHNPVIRSMLEWQVGAPIVPDAMRDADRAALCAMVEKHEGAASAEIAQQWLARQPEAVTVYRDEEGKPVGFIAMVVLSRAAPDEIAADPAARLACQYLVRNAPLRSGEIATHYRFWMADESYQDVSAVQTMILLNTVRYQLTTPGLAYHFLPCANPDFWAGAFGYANLKRLAELDYEIGGKRYGVYAHDWRAEPPFAWLALLAEREIAAEPSAVAPTQTEPLIALSEPDFANAVRDAFHDFTDPTALLGNPLVQSRLIMQQSHPTASRAERAAILQTLLKQTAESLQTTPREAKLYRALYHTFFQPTRTQEEAAEILDVPFSTYRRHLKSGVERVTQTLWHQEVGR